MTPLWVPTPVSIDSIQPHGQCHYFFISSVFQLPLDNSYLVLRRSLDILILFNANDSLTLCQHSFFPGFTVLLIPAIPLPSFV